MRDIDDFEEDTFNPDYIRIEDHEDALALLKAQFREEIGILIQAIEAGNVEDINDSVSQMLDYVDG